LHKKKVIDEVLLGEVNQCSMYLAIAANQSNSDEVRVEALARHPDCLAKIGWNLKAAPQTIDRILASAEANQKLTTSRGRQIPLSKVQFFPKDRDERSPFKKDVVVSYLDGLGFDVQVMKPQLTEVSTNAIFYSHNAPDEDIKAVAFALIRAGASIRVVRPSIANYMRDKLIQVGADAEYDNSPPLTVHQISSVNFTQDTKKSIP
jgi:hypothetical protein